MTRRLDPPRRVGGLHLWGLSETLTTGRTPPGGIAVAASKHPVAVVIDTGTAIIAFTAGGAALSTEDIARRFPDLPARLAAARAEDRG